MVSWSLLAGTFLVPMLVGAPFFVVAYGLATCFPRQRNAVIASALGALLSNAQRMGKPVGELTERDFSLLFKALSHGATFGLHSFLWIAAGAVLLATEWRFAVEGASYANLFVFSVGCCPSWGTAFRGGLYLSLSELFLFGFCYHPSWSMALNQTGRVIQSGMMETWRRL